MSSFQTICHTVDLCVVGGGLSGLCTAIAAARHGIRVALMHERPVLGGNASSEVRMWVCGAHGENNRETGIIEELLLENQYRNPEKNYSLWDTVMYEKARFQPNLLLLLNCTCMEAEMDDGRIKNVTGWQMTTQRFHRVRAEIYADCSGDSVLAPLSNARFRMGREAQSEFGERIAPQQADSKTMGMSCMIQSREDNHPHAFIPPTWANHYETRDLPHRVPDLHNPSENFWYLELGGEQDCIGDAEEVRDALYRCALGLWDYVKNDPGHAEKNRNWTLDWMGMLPGKRESRRYIGDYIMTEKDVLNQGRFDDVVAYGGWSMDDHHPGGMNTPQQPTVFHPAPSPYGIPYRCLYSVNVDNLMFAGRNISVTHAAMSSTRVMATCAILGQAVGTAAAIAIQERCTPRDIYHRHIRALQQMLMEDDCYLPFRAREVSALTASAHIEADTSGVEVLRNGVDRPLNGQENGWSVYKGGSVTYRWNTLVEAKSIRVVFDSDLCRETLPETAAGLIRPMPHNRPCGWPDSCVPKTLVKEYTISVLTPEGKWQTLVDEKNNYQRLRWHTVNQSIQAFRMTLKETWGCEVCRLFALDVR